MLFATEGDERSGNLRVASTRPVTDRLEEIVESWAKSQYELVTFAAAFADSPELRYAPCPPRRHCL